MMKLVTTTWLEKNKKKVKILDSTWHLPNTNKDPYKDYLLSHIEGSKFFDIDKNSDEKSDLPHMLVKKEKWEEIVSNLGISNDDHIVIYDNSEVKSSCRCWFNFIYFGHDQNLISILDGGLKKWQFEGKFTTNKIPKIIKSNYFAQENVEMVKSKKQIEDNIKKKSFKLLDARSLDRFYGKSPEPRPGLRAGNIKNSHCLPFLNLLNLKTNEFKKESEIKTEFEKIIKNIEDKNLVFTCGSGITASVLAFAYSIVNKDYTPIIYDGSWSEYGRYP